MTTTTIPTSKWSVDTMHSEIGFKVKHMMISNVSGKIEKFSVQADSFSDDFTNSQIKFTAQVDSINTGSADRDAHLKSDDFFNAESFPQITFKSTGYAKKNDEHYTLTGDLTIRDITKSISLNVEASGLVVDPYGQIKSGFIVEGKIKRSDFNLKWNAITEAGSIVVSDDIKILCEIQMIKQG